MRSGKTGGNSWLTSVKRAFRSPTKLGSAKKSCKRTDDEDDRNDQGEKKTEKRKWIFSKLTSPTKKWEEKHRDDTVSSEAEERQAMAIAAAEASTEAAKVAVANAKAAVNKSVVNVKQTRLAFLLRQHYAALVIQTAFRGYLARQALRALKGIVKLQALVRGHNVRKQAKAALRCMQALISVQAKMRDQYSTPLEEYGTRRSMFAESNNLWDKYKDIRQRNSISTMDEGNVEDQWEDRRYTIEDIEAMVMSKKEAALKREKALAYALSQQIRRSDRRQSMINEKDANNNTGWLKQWMESERFRENDKRSMSQRRDSIKDIDMDSILTPQTRRHSLHVASPRSYGSSYHSPMTPSFKQLQVHSASPRCHSTTTTPSLRSNCPSTVSNYSYRTSSGGPTTIPNYMAATESAKAKARSQSTPRHRSSMSERDRVGSVKKRLSFPALPESHSECTVYNEYSGFSESLRSPSFRSVQGGGYGV